MVRKNILVTGCSGRLGEQIAEKFSKKFNIIGLDIQKPEEIQTIKDYYYMDLQHDDSVENVLRHIQEQHGNRFAAVIHLAAYYSFSQQNWDLYQKITIDGTKRLLKFLRTFEVEQFIFSSTLLVYAPCKMGEKIREKSYVKPEWEYPKSKVKTERIIFEEHGDMPIAVLRIAGCYDEGCHSIPLAQQIKRIYEDQFQKSLFPGNPKHGSPFLHFEDFVEAIYLLVEKRKELPNELLLILGEPKTFSYEEIQKRLAELILNRSISIIRIPKFLAKMGAWIQNHIPFYRKPFIKPWMIDVADDHYELDISKSKKILGWKPSHSLIETLPQMVEALKRDPKKWYEEHNLNFK